MSPSSGVSEEITDLLGQISEIFRALSFHHALLIVAVAGPSGPGSLENKVAAANHPQCSLVSALFYVVEIG
ncbi:hypothetical protein Nepgr_011114 [Nepenthes gracilis]|uniref:Uncharacterized protein n=1 Tax=Nepenthes gracilis TaxID=150966 RepID=A0AAD3SDL8_NEPGR|nr:hypothetical protein Nepgr_011114 [Nepenthes gracilis]